MAKPAIVLPQPPVAAKTNNPNRPGVREVKAPEKQARPGIVAIEEADRKEAVEKPPKAPPPPPKPIELASSPIVPEHGGRIPTFGDSVVFWMRDFTQKLVPHPATLIWWHSERGKWNLNFQQIGRVQGRHDIAFSETPADSHWTWPEAKPHEARGDAMATAESAFEMCAAMAKDIAELKATIESLRKELAEAKAAIPAPKSEAASLLEALG